MEELELVRRSIQGDHEAFRTLVVAYEPQLLAYLLRMLSNWEDAHDIAQETFLAAYYALPRWKPPEQADAHDHEREAHLLAPWLYQIATNRALTLLKKQSTQRQLLNSQSDSVQLSENIQRRNRNEQRMTLEDRYVVHELLREALNHLTEEDAACLVMRFVSGEQYAEIAATLGLTAEAVRKRIARGLVVLRSVYSSLDTEVSL
ncbi:MAG: RNA polymerase sigma factor [Ktedonobacteraceae bacterium]